MILITGGGGFIGLNLARYLVDRGQEVLLLRRHAFAIPLFLTPYAGKQVNTVEGDITEPSVLYSLIKNYSVESIVHAAVATETSIGSTLYQAIKINIQGTTDVLEAARIFGLRRVTFLSSVAVYFPESSPSSILSEENDLPVSSTEWIGGTKKAGEQICLLYAREYGLSIPIVRPPQVWGPLYWTHRSPVHTMIDNAISGKPSDLSSFYGENKAPYIYVRDCAKALGLVHLAPSLKYDIYNISDGETRSLADFARAIKEVIPEARITLGETKSTRDADRPPMDITRIKSDVGFTPDYNLKKAVKAYIDWLRDSSYT
jgi:nucleoside-diphosphate-sugar epimerase